MKGLIYQQISFRFECRDFRVELCDFVGIEGAQSHGSDGQPNGHKEFWSAWCFYFGCLWKSLNDILKILNGGGNCDQADVSCGFRNRFEWLFVFVQ